MILPWELDRGNALGREADRDAIARAPVPFARAAADVSRTMNRNSMASNPTTGAAGSREAMIASAPELGRLAAAGADATLNAEGAARTNEAARQREIAENNTGLFGSMLNMGGGALAQLVGAGGGGPGGGVSDPLGGAGGAGGGMGGLLAGAAPMAGSAVGMGMGGPLGSMLGGQLGTMAGGMLGGGAAPAAAPAPRAGGYSVAPAPGSLDAGPSDPMDAWSGAPADGIPMAPRGGFTAPAATAVRPGGLMATPAAPSPALPGLPGAGAMTEEEMRRLGLI